MDMVKYLEKQIAETPRILVRCTNVNVQAMLFDMMESRGHTCRHFSCHPEQEDEKAYLFFAMESEPMAWEWKGRVVTQQELFLN